MFNNNANHRVKRRKNQNMSNNYNSVTVTTAEAEAMASQREAEKAKHQSDTAMRVRVEVGGNGGATVGGILQTRPNSMEVDTPNPDPRIVYINGMECHRDVLAQMRASGTIPPGAVIHDPFLSGNDAVEVASAIAEKNATPKDAKPVDGEGMSEAEKYEAAKTDKVFADGQTALDTARRGIGDDAVNTALAAAAESGDITPPQGVHSSTVSAVVQAYTASADSMVAGTGIDVGTLSEVLDAKSLAMARSAVVSGDTAKMQHIARQAFDTLLALPKNAPAFEAFMEEHYDDIGWDRHDNGTVTIDVEGHGPMPWESVVRMGGINVKNQVLRRR